MFAYDSLGMDHVRSFASLSSRRKFKARSTSRSCWPSYFLWRKEVRNSLRVVIRKREGNGGVRITRRGKHR